MKILDYIKYQYFWWLFPVHEESFYSKNNKYFIRNVFINSALKLLREESYSLFNINQLIHNTKEIKKLWLLKERYQQVKNLPVPELPFIPELEYTEKQKKFHDKLILLLNVKMTPEEFSSNFLVVMGEALGDILQERIEEIASEELINSFWETSGQHRNNHPLYPLYPLYLTKDKNYLLLHKLSITEAIDVLKEIYQLVCKEPEKFYAYFKDLKSEDIIKLKEDLDNTMYQVLFQYDELLEIYPKGITPNEGIFLDQKYISQKPKTQPILRPNFKNDAVSFFLKDQFQIKKYQAFRRKNGNQFRSF